jgi:hypothetical protein
MIKYLEHTQIDLVKWDNCISHSLNRRVYACSWYLNLVSPGWDALVDGDYERVFPLTRKRKLTVSYLAQPYFSQQLGVFSPGVITELQVDEFMKAVPQKFRFTEIHLNSGNMPGKGDGVITWRVNHELDLSLSFSELTGHYAQNTRRNIRKANDAGLVITNNVGVEQLIDLFRENFGNSEGKLEAKHYKTLNQLITCCLERKMGYMLGSETKEGILAAGAFFLVDQNRIYFLFAASSRGARENGAMFFLVDRFLAENAGGSMVLDFEGGNDPNLGRFYKSFGATEVPYPAIRFSRLSKVEQKAVYFMHKLRR